MTRPQLAPHGLILMAWLGVIALAAGAPAAADAPVSARPLMLEEIVLRGNARTSADVIHRYLGLAPGASVEPDDILDAVGALRASELFESVEFHTERGRERGQVRLVLDVQEKGLEFRFGTGYRDLDGWYVMPAQLRWDNRLGRGERSRLSVKLGYHIAGAELTFDENRFGKDGRGFWGASVGGFGLQRRYFVDGIEYEHSVGLGALGAHVGRRIGRAWSAEVGARFETVDADSSAKAVANDDIRGVEKGDELRFEELPAPIAAAAGERRGQVYHAQLSYDGRSSRIVASTPAAGIWGRVRAEGLLREGADALAVTLDLRAYRAVLGGAVALRGRAGAIGTHSAFYDRFHLGGLYTVRGFPSQSLSDAEGDTRFWTASLEYRGPLLGRRDRPTVMGVLFADAGQGWTDGHAAEHDVSGSVGFGFRLRVPWFDSVGFDFGAPIGRTPIDESFHAHGALGWNF